MCSHDSALPGAQNWPRKLGKKKKFCAIIKYLLFFVLEIVNRITAGGTFPLRVWLSTSGLSLGLRGDAKNWQTVSNSELVTSPTHDEPNHTTEG